ncbi:MAG: radical SAM protein [archaeon]
MGEQRDYKLVSFTLGMCPQCMKTIPTKIIERDGAIYLLKNCKEHGEQIDLLEEDAEFYNNRHSYNKPSTSSKTQTLVDRGCPFDCGLCPDHEQHTCIGLIEVTPLCDLGCPVCYACAGAGEPLKIEKIGEMMDFFQDAESGKAEILQISGGEPTMHPDIIKIIELAREKKFKYVMLNTNGLRLAQDEEFVKELSKFRGGFEIYLQFDGFDAKTYSYLRGRDILDIKKKAIENLDRYEIPTTLVATVEKGINDGEIGQIIEFGIKTKCVRGINFQPIAFFGRLKKEHNLKDRVTLTGILKRIEEQTKGMLKKSDFVPLPCDIDRVAVTYLYRSKDEFVPITRMLDIKNYIQVIDNTFAFDAESIMDRVKEQEGCCDISGFVKAMRQFVTPYFLLKSEKEKIKFVDENTFRISVTSFIDAYNFDMASMKRECVHIITPDLKRIPFSSFNMIHRKKYAKSN